MTPEAELKKKMKAALKERGAFWSVVTGGAYSKPGDPDIIACYKGRYVAIEAKTPEGRQSDVQKQRQHEIEAAGGIYLLARSVDAVLKALDAIDAE